MTRKKVKVCTRVKLFRCICCSKLLYSCEVWLPDPRIAQRHCELLRTNDGWRVTDLGSGRPTVVNDQPVTAAPFNAHVQLITSHDLELRVRIAPPTPPVSPREFVEYVKFDKDRSSFVVNVAQGKPVQVGDWAFLSEDKWLREARGFLVRQVECISDDPDDPHNYKHVIIRPLIREDSLWAVTVLVSKSC